MKYIHTLICLMTHLDLLSTVAMKMVPTITQMMITATPSTIIRITAHCGSAPEAGGVATGFTGSGGEAGREERRRHIINNKDIGCANFVEPHTFS